MSAEYHMAQLETALRVWEQEREGVSLYGVSGWESHTMNVWLNTESAFDALEHLAMNVRVGINDYSERYGKEPHESLLFHLSDAEKFIASYRGQLERLQVVLRDAKRMIEAATEIAPETYEVGPDWMRKMEAHFRDTLKEDDLS